MEKTEIGDGKHAQEPAAGQDVGNERAAEHDGNTERCKEYAGKVSAVLKIENSQGESEGNHGETEQHAEQKNRPPGAGTVDKMQQQHKKGTVRSVTT